MPENSHSDNPDMPIRTARKPWVCVNCGRTIERGERHMEYLGEAPAYSSGSRYCAECSASIWQVVVMPALRRQSADDDA